MFPLTSVDCPHNGHHAQLKRRLTTEDLHQDIPLPNATEACDSPEEVHDPDDYRQQGATPEPEDSDDEVPRDWVAPPEPLRPSNPYQTGRQFEIRRHKACPPFGSDYPNYPGVRNEAPMKELRITTRVQLCLDHPPMEGETASDDPPRTLHILDQIRAGDEGGAQIIVCRLDDEPTPYVAKIYDPLYYGFGHTLFSGRPRDVTDEADQDYCREVPAYLELDDRFGGNEIPRYHGSWTFQLPLQLPEEPAPRIRDVRMILLEKIPGHTMLDVDPSLYSESARMDAVARIMEALARISHAGVYHHDVYQRNFMLCEGAVIDKERTIGRVVILDFNIALVARLDDFEAEWGPRREKPPKPCNPIDRWWDGGGMVNIFDGWLPESWERQLLPLRQWVFDRWAESPDFERYEEPLEWDQAAAEAAADEEIRRMREATRRPSIREESSGPE